MDGTSDSIDDLSQAWQKTLYEGSDQITTSEIK